MKKGFIDKLYKWKNRELELAELAELKNSALCSVRKV